MLNHVGQPKTVLAELRRVVRANGWIALTVWAAPPAAGQALLGRAVQAADAVRPAHLPARAPEDDFPHDESGLTDLLGSVGLRETACETLRWDHRASAVSRSTLYRELRKHRESATAEQVAMTNTASHEVILTGFSNVRSP